MGNVFETTPQQIVTGVAGQIVIPFITNDDIVTRTAIKQVSTKATVNSVSRSSVDFQGASTWLGISCDSDKLASAISIGIPVVTEDNVCRCVTFTAIQRIVTKAPEDNIRTQV